MSFDRAGRVSLASCMVFAFSMAAVAREPLPRTQPATQGVAAERLQRLDDFLASTVESGQYLGAVTLIARNGRVIHWNAHGRRELGSTDALATDAIFRIYSMTKPIASVAALMLMEQGKYQLDDPVSNYLPEFADVRVFAGGTADAPELRQPKRPVSIRHLFIHAAGFATGGEAVPLAADPGTRFNYDGVHAVVLSRLIEVWSGQPFDRFLQERIFAPLRMQDTGFEVPMKQRDRIAQMTSTDAQGQLIPAPAYANVEPGVAMSPYPNAGGGLYSTAADYLRFAQMLLNGGELDGASILSRKTVGLMMTNQLGNLDPPRAEFRPGEGFGLGGYVGIDPARRGRLGSVGDFGWSGAASTYFTVDNHEGLVALLLMQHLPQGLPRDPPRLSGQFYNLVYQSLQSESAP